VPKTRVDDYRENAVDCRERAEHALSQPDKERWLSLARSWDAMAEQAEKGLNSPSP
jgi:hypothetical protein